MKGLDCEIQYPDLSSDERGRLLLQDAKRTVSEFSWPAYAATYQKMKEEGRDCTPPRVVFFDGDDQLMVRSLEGGTFDTHITLQHKYCFLGLELTRNRDLDIDRLTFPQLSELLAAFFAEDHQRVRQLASEAQAG